jgi:hypothetical protein
MDDAWCRLSKGVAVSKVDFKLLSQAEKDLVLATKSRELKGLDEEELLDLHKRARKARNKYTKLYRRQARAQVSADKSRAKASRKNQRTLEKAEIFEAALERVSARLAHEARRSADRLRDARLAQARAGRGPFHPDRPSSHDIHGPRPDVNRRARDRAPVELRTAASTRAAKQRRHAAR